MRDWLTKFEFKEKQNRYTSIPAPVPTPFDNLLATRIREELSTAPVDFFSVVDQYVLGCYYFMGRGYSLMNDGTSELVNEELLRLKGMTKKGTVWLRGEYPAILNIDEFAIDVVRQFEKSFHEGSVSPIIKLMFLEQEQRNTEFERMHFYSVNKAFVTPKEMHPDLRSICKFVSSASGQDNITNLQVSGWNFDDLDPSNELLSMLLSEYNELELIVSPGSRRVQCIRSFDKLQPE